MPGTSSTRSFHAATYRGARVRTGKAVAEHKQLLTRLHRRVRNARRLVYGVAARGLAAALRRVPYPLLRVCCRALIVPVAHAMFARRAEQNLMAAFGDALAPAARRRVLRAMFRGIADIPAEVLAMVQQGEPFVERLFAGDRGIGRWRELQRGHAGGIVAVTGHLGNWEALLQWLHLHGGGIGGAVAKRIPNPRLNRLVEELRGRFGVPTLYAEQGARELARVLAAGEVLGLVPDQDMAEVGGTFIEFFGRPAYTPTGPARLALATGAPIVVVCSRRTAGGIETFVEGPFFPDLAAPRAAEIRRLTQAWSRAIEDFIRVHPDAWVWFHDRWSTTPAKLAARARGAG